MTSLPEVLSHCIAMAKYDKAYAWWAAKNYAQQNPEEFSALPDMLIFEMKKIQQQTENK